jgi:isopenicillin N synthase-like dioxygenase
LETKHSYEIPGIGGQRGYVSLEQNMLKVEKRRLKRVLAFWSVRWRKFKICFRIPENVVVKELPRFNATGKEKHQMLEKTGVYVLRALALRLGLDEFYFDNYAKMEIQF